MGICTMNSVGFGHTFPRYETDEEAVSDAKVCLNGKSVWGHHNPYYPKVLSKGLNGIVEEAKELKAKVPASGTKTRSWHEAVIDALNGAMFLAERYARLTRYLAGEVGTKQRKEELLGSFLVKFHERVQLNNEHIEDHFTFGQSSNHWLRNCNVSGLTPEGKDGKNELSHLVIDLVNELELIDPLVSVRLHKDSPEEIFDTTAKWIVKGGAQPTVFNDDTVIPGMVKHLSIPVEDARDYSNDGCWETLPCLRPDFGYGRIEILKSNWQGEERLRQNCMNMVPEFGNGDDGADSIGVDLFTYCCDCFDMWNKKVDWIIFALGIGTFGNCPRLGYVCGAWADGRLAQAPIASNYSPSFGMDRNGF